MHLPYYDNIRFTIIDIMDNLYLGSAKRIVHTEWMESRLISNKDFSVIQERIISCILPINGGRILRKIASAFHCLTADEWKNWTLLFSLMVLHDILPPDHLACWKLFLSPCQIYCQSVISLVDIEKARVYGCIFQTSRKSLWATIFNFEHASTPLFARIMVHATVSGYSGIMASLVNFIQTSNQLKFN